VNIVNRIQKLEKTTRIGKPERKTWVIVEGEPDPLDIKEHDLVIRVSDEEVKQVVLKLLSGERRPIVEAKQEDSQSVT